MYKSINLIDESVEDPLLISNNLNHNLNLNLNHNLNLNLNKISFLTKIILCFFCILSISQIIIGCIAYYYLNNSNYLDYWLIGNGLNMSLICMEYILIKIKQILHVFHKVIICCMILNILILIGSIIVGLFLYASYSNIISPTFVQAYVLIIILFELFITFISSRLFF